MKEIIIGERVRTLRGETGVIESVDRKGIHVRFGEHLRRMWINAFWEKRLRYENAELQQALEDEWQRRTRLVQERTPAGVKLDKASLRLGAADITFSKVRKGDQALIREVFAGCDAETDALFDQFRPQMEYPRLTSHSRSKYAVGYLCKHADTYVFRVFSRNDVYKQTKRDGVTVFESDTTEVMRSLVVNGRVYTFTKNISYSLGHINHSPSYNEWHVSDMVDTLTLNRVVRGCDCGYLNEYIAEENVLCYLYVDLLHSALRSNKAEIAFKHKAYSVSSKLDIVAYLEPFTTKQVDFAAQYNVMNTLPLLQKFGLYDRDLLRRLEPVCKPRRFGRSTLRTIREIFQQNGWDVSEADQRLVRFVKGADPFLPSVYSDYVDALLRRPGVTMQDVFDKDYVERHDVLMAERLTRYDQEESAAYRKMAKELSWIDREDNGYFIMVPKTIEEFRAEGASQHNCVYTNAYFRSVIGRRSIIVFLRKKKDASFVTIEFDYATFGVVQAYGKHNHPLDDTLYQYIVSLGKRLFVERASQG